MKTENHRGLMRPPSKAEITRQSIFALLKKYPGKTYWSADLATILGINERSVLAAMRALARKGLVGIRTEKVEIPLKAGKEAKVRRGAFYIDPWSEKLRDNWQ